MRQRNQNSALRAQKRMTATPPHLICSQDKTRSIVAGCGVSVFDEEGEWTGMMMMNNPIPNRATVVWLIPLVDDPAM